MLSLLFLPINHLTITIQPINNQPGQVLKISYIYKNKFTVSRERKKQFKELVNQISEKEKKYIAGINLIFCSDEFIRDYNNIYLKHDHETDIITFHDVNEEGFTEGELLISTDSVKNNSIRFKTDFETELMRVIAHGVLHLCGYKDKTKAEKKIMTEKEDFYLKKN